jgi:AraC-like DNA-binding protein
MAETTTGGDELTLRVWRPPDVPRLVVMRTILDSYGSPANSEYAIGVIQRRGLTVRRGRERHHLHPGDLGVWDLSGVHVGAPLDGGPWECNLIAIEQPDLEAAVRDPADAEFDLVFPQPVVRDATLAARFLRLHRMMQQSASTLERQGLLVSWLQDLAERSPSLPSRRAAWRAARTDPALRSACERLRDEPTRNLTLQELADAAGVSRFRLVRLFRMAFGVAPHAFQVAQRVKAARRHLEAGGRPAEVAALVGFHDQSHLNRHFVRTMGFTPAEYARSVQQNG